MLRANSLSDTDLALDGLRKINSPIKTDMTEKLRVTGNSTVKSEG